MLCVVVGGSQPGMGRLKMTFHTPNALISESKIMDVLVTYRFRLNYRLKVLLALTKEIILW